MVDWLAEYVEDGTVAFRIGREGERVIAEWPEIVEVSARRDGTDVTWSPRAHANPLDLRKIERGSARLLLRDLEGKLAMHGAALSVDGRGLVLLGRSGQGKSTLAASLCEHLDAALHSDDAVGLEQVLPSSWLIEPFESDHWLDADACRAVSRDPPSIGKLPRTATRTAQQSAKLLGMLDLRYDDALTVPRLRRLGGIDAIAALVPQVVRFILDDDARQRRELERLVALTNDVSMFALERPRGFAHLAATAELVRSLLASEDQSSRLGFPLP